MEPDYKPSYRAQLIRRFGSRIPTTGEGIPTGFYRVDMLPSSAPSLGSRPEGSVNASGAVTQEDGGSEVLVLEAKAMGSPPVAGQGQLMTPNEDNLPEQLRAAFVELTFDYGYPGLPNGMPFWHKLDFESGFAFAAFQFYLESGQDGPRELFMIAENDELHNVASNQVGRTITKQELLFSLQEYFIVNCWAPRAKAFDLYRETAWRHQRLRRQNTTENSHYNLADALLAKLKEYFQTERFINEMSPKAALDALAKLVAIQRISIGLPASGPLPVNQQPDATSFEMIMRNVAMQQGAGNSQQAGAQHAAHTKQLMDQVLSDPTAAGNLQEVIIRITSATVDANGGPPERRFPGRNRGPMTIEEGEFIDVSTANIPR